MRTLIFFLTFSFCSSAYSQHIDSLMKSIKSTNITALNTTESHVYFLENIYKADQQIREIQAGNESNNSLTRIEKIDVLRQLGIKDRLLFDRTVDYLEQHSYPIEVYGETACLAPYLVLHHVWPNAENIKLKKKYFPLIYKAYEDEVLQTKSVKSYLYRLHRDIKRSVYHETEMTEKEQIEFLIKILGLSKTVNS